MQAFFDTFLWMTLLVSLFTDLTKRRIYNKVVYPVVLLALAAHLWLGGLSGLEFSAAGLFLGLMLLIIPFAMGGIGAGDVKLLGAVGALMGPVFVCYTALGTALAGGLLAAAFALRRHIALETSLRVALAASLLIRPGREGRSIGGSLLEHQPYSPMFPYAAAIMIGTMLAYGLPLLFH